LDDIKPSKNTQHLQRNYHVPQSRNPFKNGTFGTKRNILTLTYKDGIMVA